METFWSQELKYNKQQFLVEVKGRKPDIKYYPADSGSLEICLNGEWQQRGPYRDPSSKEVMNGVLSILDKEEKANSKKIIMLREIINEVGYRKRGWQKLYYQVKESIPYEGAYS